MPQQPIARPPQAHAWLRRPERDIPGFEAWELPSGVVIQNPLGAEIFVANAPMCELLRNVDKDPLP